jgi:hypothetical protein
MDRKPAMTKGQMIGAFVVAIVCGAVVTWLCFGHPSFGGYKLGGAPIWAWLVGVLGTVLVVDVPICFMILIGHPPVMTLSPLIPSAEERAHWKRLRERPLLNDDAFYERFYAGTGIPKEIPFRLRRQYAEELRMDAVWPEDKAREFDWELDFGDLLGMVEKDFGVRFTEEDIRHLDGSFDSLVRSVTKKVG